MSALRPVVFAFAGILVAGCGATNNSGPEGSKAGAGSSGEAGTLSTGGSAVTGGRGGNSGGAGGTRDGSGGSGAEAVGGNSGSGGTSSGGTSSGGTSSSGAGGTGASGKGGTSTGAGGTGATAGTTTSGGSSAGSAAGGASGHGAGGNAGQRAIQCTGATQYFPEFDRACAKAEDCVAVAHQTNCCGAQLVTGISASERATFDAAEATCAQQYPACGCAAFGVDVEDGTRVEFAWKDQVEVACEAGSCKAHYSGTSFTCGTLRCTEQQYCVQSSGGPAGTPTSYSCNPTACTDCSCITMPDCTCSDTDGHVTVTCQRA